MPPTLRPKIKLKICQDFIVIMVLFSVIKSEYYCDDDPMLFECSEELPKRLGDFGKLVCRMGKFLLR